MIKEVKNMQIELSKMTNEEKLKLIEFIWSDLEQTDSEVPSPKWHKKILIQREEDIKNDNEEILDWASAKENILKTIYENKNTKIS